MSAGKQSGEQMDGNVDRKVLWADDRYQLEEAASAAQLLRDAMALANPLAKHFSLRVGNGRIAPDTEEALFHFLPWRQVQLGWRRYFTLTRSGRPVALVDYNCRTEEVEKMRGANNQLLYHQTGEDGYWFALCAALWALKAQLPIGLVYDTWELFGGVIKRDGKYDHPSRETVSEAIVGHLLGGADPEDAVEQALGMRNMTVFVSDAETWEVVRGMERVEAKLVSPDAEIDLGGVRHCGRLVFPEAHTVTMPALETSGDIVCRYVREVSAPALRIMGEALLGKAESVVMPSLQFADWRNWPGASLRQWVDEVEYGILTDDDRFARAVSGLRRAPF